MSFNRERYMFSCKPDCENRKPGCHSRCEKYIKEKAEYEKLKAAANKDRDVRHYVAEGIAKSCDARAKSQKATSIRKWVRSGQ